MDFPSLQDKVVVITGASSGIGKLAVQEFLNQGARVVLAARSEDAMQEHLQTMEVGPDRALVVPVDVSKPDDVAQLAQKTLEHFGRVDVWINGASISTYAAVEQLEPHEFERVIQVNLLGSIYGSREALKIFKKQRYGNLINISSVLGKSSVPLQSAYVAAKHGIVGFTSSLREEMMAEGLYPEIGISVILPASMDTPFFLHARSKLGRVPKPINPVYHPAKTVNALLECARHPQPEIVVGFAGKLMIWGYSNMPRVLEKWMSRQGIRDQMTNYPLGERESQDNFDAPMPGFHTIQGGFQPTGEYLKDYARKHPLRIALSVALPVGLTWLVLNRGKGIRV